MPRTLQEALGLPAIPRFRGFCLRLRCQPRGTLHVGDSWTNEEHPIKAAFAGKVGSNVASSHAGLESSVGTLVVFICLVPQKAHGPCLQ